MRTKRLFGRCEDFHTGRRTFNDYFHFFTFCLTAICIPYDSDDRFRTLQVHSVVGNRLVPLMVNFVYCTHYATTKCILRSKYVASCRLVCPAGSRYLSVLAYDVCENLWRSMHDFQD